MASEYTERIASAKRRWDSIVEAAYAERGEGLPSQNAIIGAVNSALSPRDVLVCAAGSLPGDLHKMWRVRDPYGYHVEYAYSCMGYEIPGGLGVKRAALAEAARQGSAENNAGPREVVVMVGDGSYLMMHTELVTAVAEGIKLIVVLVQNHGYASIGALSESLGSQRFGTQYRRLEPGEHSFDTGPTLPVDLAANAASLGVRVIRSSTPEELASALAEARAAPEGSGPVLIHIESDPLIDAPSSQSWWDVPVAATSELKTTRAAREEYERQKMRQRRWL